MDCEKQYIDMCREAIEIEWTPKIGDYFCEGDYTHLLSYYERMEGNWTTDAIAKRIWLPRQDQLQEMAGFRRSFAGYNVWHFCKEIAEFANNDDKWQIMGSSFEQLWLAFVMHEKFNKHWNGTTWYEQPELEV